MSYEKVATAERKVIGVKQTLKALENNDVSEVFIATDADPKVLLKVIHLAESKNIPIIKLHSMKKMGRACGIDVSAATVAIVN